MSRSNYQATRATDYKYNASDWIGGIGSGAASGASAGSSFGPWGTLIGGIGGAMVGGYTTGKDQEKARIAAEQQDALNRDLNSRDQYDRFLSQAALSNAVRNQDQTLQAQQAASRGNLTGAATAGLLQQTSRDQAMQASAEKPGMFLAAQQAEQGRRAQVLQEYQVAQALANNAAPQDRSQMWGDLSQATAMYGTMKKGRSAYPNAQADPADVQAAQANVWQDPATSEGSWWGADSNVLQAQGNGVATQPPVLYAPTPEIPVYAGGAAYPVQAPAVAPSTAPTVAPSTATVSPVKRPSTPVSGPGNTPARAPRVPVVAPSGTVYNVSPETAAATGDADKLISIPAFDDGVSSTEAGVNSQVFDMTEYPTSDPGEAVPAYDFNKPGYQQTASISAALNKPAFGGIPWPAPIAERPPAQMTRDLSGMPSTPVVTTDPRGEAAQQALNAYTPRAMGVAHQLQPNKYNQDVAASGLSPEDYAAFLNSGYNSLYAYKRDYLGY